jgi:hypothetical protein
MIDKFRILSTHHCADVNAKVGDVVYRAAKPDYGCASDDEHHWKMPFLSVTFDRGGDYPFFTIPLHNLEKVE